MMQYLHIQTHDPLLFGSGKPFSMGEETSIEGATFPQGSTLWGAMYSHLLLREQVRLNAADQQKLRIHAVYLYDAGRKSIYVPTPADVSKDDNEHLYPPAFLAREGVIAGINQYGYPYLLRPYTTIPYTSKTVESAAGTWISLLDLRIHYTATEETVFNRMELKSEDSFTGTYSKTGIGRNNKSGSAEEAMLYRINMVEYAPDWGYIVAYQLDESISFASNGILKLGGDGKTVTFSTINQPQNLKDWREWQAGTQTNLFKLYFQSPGVLDTNLKQQLEGAGFTFQAVSLPRARPMGGFDMRQTQPKPMQRMWPAGAIFVLSVEKEKSIKELVQTIRKILQTHPANQQGKGHFFLIPITETLISNEL